MSYADKIANAESNVDKLPKWAQEYVTSLKRRAVSAERELAEAKAGPEDSNVFRVWGLRPDDQPIGKNCSIRFQMDDGRGNGITVRILSDGSLNVNGDERFTIMPTSSNDIRIRLEH